MSASSQGANHHIPMRTTASGRVSLTLRLRHVHSWICVCGLETQTPGSQPALMIPKARGAGSQPRGAEL